MAFRSIEVRCFPFPWALVCLLTLSAVLPVHAEGQPVLKPSLDGTWIAVAEESDGKRMKKSDVKKMEKVLELDGERFVLSWSGRRIQGTVELLPEEEPAAIDLSGKLPTGKSVVLRGIYELKGDTLRLCYAIHTVNGDDIERPEEFETEEGTRHVCVTYERKK